MNKVAAVLVLFGFLTAGSHVLAQDEVQKNGVIGYSVTTDSTGADSSPFPRDNSKD